MWVLWKYVIHADESPFIHLHEGRKTGFSWFWKVRENRQRSDFRLWERGRLRERRHSSPPLVKWLGVFETINWQGSNFHKDDTFLSFTGSTTAYQHARQYRMSHSFFCCCGNFCQKSHWTWIMWTCPFFFSLSACAWQSYAFKRAPFVFQETTGRRALKLSQMKKEQKKRQILFRVRSVGR